MPMPKCALILVSLAATSLASGGVTSAVAQTTPADVVGELAVSEGIFVDAKTFKIAKGKAKGDPAAQIAKMGAKEVGPGAIIFRHGDKLYMVEGTPPPAVQAMKNFQDDWAVSYAKAMKEFQDDWNKGNMKDQNAVYMKQVKDFQDAWAVSYMKQAKDFQDKWAVSYMKNQNASYMKDQNASYMKGTKDFQDDWKVSYMKASKDFQDGWKSNMQAAPKDFQDSMSNYMKAAKDFQDKWNVSYVKNQNAVYMKDPNPGKDQNAVFMKQFQDNWATGYMK